MFRKTSIFFIVFAWSIHAATTFNVVKTPVPVFLTQNEFFDPVVLITENQLGIAFLYDSTAHSIFYSLLQKNSSTWSTPSLIISNAYSSPSACIDDQGSGAVCTTSTTGVTVVRFQANTSNIATIDKTDFNCQGASAPVVCVGGPGKQVIAWKQNSVTPNQYFIGFSPSYNSSTWNVLEPILPSQGNAHDFCLVGNMGGDCAFIWNDSSGNNYGQYYSQRVNVSLQSLDNKVSLPISSPDLLHQYEGYAAISTTGDVLFSWTYGKNNSESYIQVSSLFKGASSWSNAITLQPAPPSGNVNYQRTSRCAINSVNGVVVWEFRDQANTSNSKNDYLARISLNSGSITNQPELLIPGSLSTPYSYIDRPGNIVVTFNANNTNYSACLLESESLTFNPSISLGNITPKGGEPAKIAFTNGSIHHGLIIFEDTTKNNTYSSICKLFSTANGLIYIFNKSSPISYQKES